MTPAQQARVAALLVRLPGVSAESQGGQWHLVGELGTTLVGDSGPLRFATAEGLLSSLEAMAGREVVR